MKNQPDFTAARNNLALAYYYMGQFEKAMETIRAVLDIDAGNLHALCNMAIFHQHFGNKKELAELTSLLVQDVSFSAGSCVQAGYNDGYSF